MNTEEKILEMLTQMNSHMDQMQGDISAIKDEQAQMRADVGQIRYRPL